MFFYDPTKDEVISPILVPTNFEDIQINGSKYCNESLNQKDGLYYQKCSVIISYQGYDGIHKFGDHELVIHKPATKVTNKNIIEVFNRQM